MIRDTTAEFMTMPFYTSHLWNVFDKSLNLLSFIFLYIVLSDIAFLSGKQKKDPRKIIWIVFRMSSLHSSTLYIPRYQHCNYNKMKGSRLDLSLTCWISTCRRDPFVCILKEHCAGKILSVFFRILEQPWQMRSTPALYRLVFTVEYIFVQERGQTWGCAKHPLH